MSEEMLVRYCSPTLAGIKTANMFSCSYPNKAGLYDFIRKINKMLDRKGLRLIPLKVSDGRALIYLYRPRRLERDLENDLALSLLTERCYSVGSSNKCIRELIIRLGSGGEFPHEIGLFLGYPPGDVYGFIKNRASGAKCSGAWKVYGDVAAAEKTFAEFKRCTDIYYSRFSKGESLLRLVVEENV